MAYQLFQGQTLPTRRNVERSIRRMLQGEDGVAAHIEIKECQVLGRGIHRVAYLVNLDVRPDYNQASGSHVLLYPYEEEAVGLKTRLNREIQTLMALETAHAAFRFPKLIASTDFHDAIVILERHVEGVPIDMRAGRCMVGKPWEVAGEIAARVHDLRGVGSAIGGFPTRQAHALSALQDLDGHQVALFKDAKAWCLENLPPDEPATLLHGDLSGQNIIVDLNGRVAPALIDWTFAIQGDPAHELAIITQGKRRPFEVDRGHEKLLEAYEDAGGQPIRVEEVYLYELCLFGRRYRAAKTKGRNRVESPQEPLRLLHGLITRLTKPSRQY
jgi:hypothetical protein